MKRVSILLVLTFAFVFALSGVAYANFGPHGGYWDDTDACAGCHRAHTSFSPIRWTERAIGDHTRSALLVSSATVMSDFCTACHGDDAPGASTNVVSGIFDSGPSSDPLDDAAAVPAQPIVDQLYETNSEFGAALNAGGFRFIGGTDPVTSTHRMEVGTVMWGFGNSVTNEAATLDPELTCTHCHDPHGSSNYRILRDSLHGEAVGGCVNGEPQPFVISAEENYPPEGWKKFEDGYDQMQDYRPNYTSPEYARQAPDGTQMRSMSGWCAGCHVQYNNKSSAYDYGDYEANTYITDFDDSEMIGMQDRHRHPVDTTLVAARGPVGVRSFTNEVELSDLLPLEQDGASLADRTTWEYEDYIGCLTCHRAHGTAATMEGWAVAEYYHDDDFDSLSGEDYTPDGFWKPRPVDPATAEAVADRHDGEEGQLGLRGVNPTFSSALLRTDNRGVCQRCHRM